MIAYRSAGAVDSFTGFIVRKIAGQTVQIIFDGTFRTNVYDFSIEELCIICRERKQYII